MPQPTPHDIAEPEKGEPPRAFEAFLLYCEQPEGERSHKLVTADLRAKHPERFKGSFQTALRRIDEYARIWRWTERVELFDARVHDSIRREAEKAVREMNTRQAREAAAISQQTSLHLNNLLKVDLARSQRWAAQVVEALDNGWPVPHPPEFMIHPRELVALQRSQQEIHRIALGEAAMIEAQRSQQSIRIEFSADDSEPTLPPDVAGARAGEDIRRDDAGYVGFNPAELHEPIGEPEPDDPLAVLLDGDGGDEPGEDEGAEEAEAD